MLNITPFGWFHTAISLVSLFSGILNSLSRFTAAAFAPSLLNFALVGALFFPSRIPALNPRFSVMPIPITARGAEKLKEELQRLKSADRPAVIQTSTPVGSTPTAPPTAARTWRGFPIPTATCSA